MKIFHFRIGLAGVAGLIIVIGFLVTSLTSYFFSTSSAKRAILNYELPLTSDNVYSEIQHDLLSPVFVSSLMASDTFLRDWILSGEQDTGKITKYLREIKTKYRTITSFFVSEKSRNYYYFDGILKQVSPEEPRDIWYFRVRAMEPDYEINVDPDMANSDTMTIFINYKVLDYQGNFIGATGVGLTVGTVKAMIEEYQSRFGRSVYFADRSGKIILHGSGFTGPDRLQDRPGLAEFLPELLDKGGSVEFASGGETILLSTRFIPELNWVLVVEQSAGRILTDFRSSLKLNLIICALVTLLVVWLIRHTVQIFHRQLTTMALQDGLTGIGNRRAFSQDFQRMTAQANRHGEPLSCLLIDIDHFKPINDNHGHMIGDLVIKQVAETIQGRIRGEDTLYRWGGEEYLVLLKGADRSAASHVAEQIRATIESGNFGSKEQKIRITASFGVARFLKSDVEATLIARVDQALYQAKAAGRNRVELEKDRDEQPPDN